MEYSIEELLPLVDKLTRKYTSNESSSVTYETARMLMDAVIYCIEECHNYDMYTLQTNREKMDAANAYQHGFNLVISKVYKAKEEYESILDKFRDFGCRNCRDTIIKGIPQFFLKYDPKFNPQDHLLTLDYPTIMPISKLRGIDAIYQYLCNINLEWDFLNAFETKPINNLLQKVVSDYKNLYLDNISNTVLLNVLGCIVVKKPVGMLELNMYDIENIHRFFENDSEDKIEEKIKVLISKLFQEGFHENEEMEKYFLYTSKDYAIRIMNGIQNHSLAGVFNVIDTINQN